MKRILLILLAAGLWHSSASAEDYYWSWSGVSAWNGPSPSSLCTQYASQTTRPSSSYKFHDASGFLHVAHQYNCIVTWRYVSPVGDVSDVQTTHHIMRSGTGCALPKVFNPTTGECVEPEDSCADKAGVEEAFSKAGTAPDNFVTISSSGHAIVQRGACKGGCAAEVTDRRGKTQVSGAYFYRGTFVYTGQQCATTGVGTEIDEDTNDSTEPETIKEDVPCIYSASGDKQVCESKRSEEKEGQSCGTVNGVQTCIDKAPTKNGVDIRTEITTETKPDGSSTTTKKDTATVTKCTGMKKCTTSTTTNTTTTEKDGTGKVTSVSGNCVGEHCPDKKTDPDGNGDGLGDCATGDCAEGEGGQDWFEPGEDTFASVLEKFSTDVLATPVASQTTNFMTFNASGSCPRWTVNAWVFDIRLEQLCTGDIPWAAIKAIILAAAAFFAFRIAFL